MNVDPTVLSWKDWLLVGVSIGLWLGNRGRRHMGERVGALEKAVAAALGLAGDSAKHERKP